MKKSSLFFVLAFSVVNLFSDEIKIGDKINLSLFRLRDDGWFYVIDTSKIDFFDCRWDEIKVAVDQEMCIDRIWYEKKSMTSDERAAFEEKFAPFIDKDYKWDINYKISGRYWWKKNDSYEGILDTRLQSGRRFILIVKDIRLYSD
jgi:hypothetical protein